jgi:hypothetical protein
MSTAIYDSEDKRAYAFHDVSGETDTELSLDFTMTLLTDENGVPDSIESFNIVSTKTIIIDITENYK